MKPYKIVKTSDNRLAIKILRQEEEQSPIKKESKPAKKLDFDINNDGVVDKTDISLMAKHVGKRGGRPKKSKK